MKELSLSVCSYLVHIFPEENNTVENLIIYSFYCNIKHACIGVGYCIVGPQCRPARPVLLGRPDVFILEGRQ